MKITKKQFTDILASHGFDGIDIEIIFQDLFADQDEAELEDAKERVLADALDSLSKEYDLRASGDIAYMI